MYSWLKYVALAIVVLFVISLNLFFLKFEFGTRVFQIEKLSTLIDTG